MIRKIVAIALTSVVVICTVITVPPDIDAKASYVDDFLATVGPMCTNDMRDNHILASFTLAQAIYESGWGRSTLAVEANNLFGMRAYSTWTGKVYDKNQGVLYDSWAELVSKKGSSYVNTYAMSFWRAFDNWQESVYSHSELFNTSSRYENLRGNYDYASCCSLVVKDGYCTDSGYTENLIGLIESYNLEQYNYDFGADGDTSGDDTPSDDPALDGENVFKDKTVSYYLKGKWNEYSGTTALATDGLYRGDGTNKWNGNSAVNGVTFDTADYNGTSATTNYFTVVLDEATDLSAICINGYRENGNRNYLTLDVFVSSDAVNIDAETYSSLENDLTKIDYELNKKTILGAPTSAEVYQYFDLELMLKDAASVKSVVIRTNASCASGGFFQFDEITAYSCTEPFIYSDDADTAKIFANMESGYLISNCGVVTAKTLTSQFADKEIGIFNIEGTRLEDDFDVATGHIITTTINGNSTSLVVVVRGDINCDASITTADCITLLLTLKSSTFLENESLLAADVDNDNDISTTDYSLLKFQILYN